MTTYRETLSPALQAQFDELPGRVQDAFSSSQAWGDAYKNAPNAADRHEVVNQAREQLNLPRIDYASATSSSSDGRSWGQIATDTFIPETVQGGGATSGAYGEGLSNTWSLVARTAKNGWSSGTDFLKRSWDSNPTLTGIGGLVALALGLKMTPGVFNWVKTKGLKTAGFLAVIGIAAAMLTAVVNNKTRREGSAPGSSGDLSTDARRIAADAGETAMSGQSQTGGSHAPAGFTCNQGIVNAAGDLVQACTNAVTGQTLELVTPQ